jgi:hypothetical protein
MAFLRRLDSGKGIQSHGNGPDALLFRMMNGNFGAKRK